MVPRTFKKSERLSKKISIQELFTRGSSFYVYPFKVIYLPHPEGDLHEILISVPKRNFKKAVVRNKLKRRIREAYRRNKDHYQIPSKLRIAYIYTSKEVLCFQDIQKKLILVGERLKKTFIVKNDENEKNKEV